MRTTSITCKIWKVNYPFEILTGDPSKIHLMTHFSHWMIFERIWGLALMLTKGGYYGKHMCSMCSVCVLKFWNSKLGN